MENQSTTLDPVWEQEVYGKGQNFSRYPFDAVVSFVYRNYPRSRPRREVRILEVGCGSGNNLWFAAREGFAVAGIDGSESAITFARNRFAEEALAGEFHVGNFTSLPFADGSFDLAIDRAALTCSGFSAARKAVAEIHRTLTSGGRFFFNPYSDRHSSYASGTPGPDGLRMNIDSGTLVHVGQICCYGRRDIDSLFADGWKLLNVQHMEWLEQLEPDFSLHAEWRVVAERIP